MSTPYPLYHQLPEEVPGYRCSWQHFRSLHSGTERSDGLGMLNNLTAARRKAAAREIVLGRSISLDLPLDHFKADISAFGGRPAPQHVIKHVERFVCEDLLNFNTQSASQWDGFRHFGIRATGQYYCGVKVDDFQSSNILGIDEWIRNGGIIGRGVLIDFLAWAQFTGQVIDVNSGRAITFEEILAVLHHQKTLIQPGDILVFRTGWLDWYNRAEVQSRHNELCIRNAPGKHSFIGISSTEEFVAWIWNNQIAAVAGDQVAFECTPPPEGGFGWLHEHLLGALGCPIGELWDTEELSKACHESGKFTFFLTSSPIHVRGGVASPANAIAIL